MPWLLASDCHLRYRHLGRPCCLLSWTIQTPLSPAHCRDLGSALHDWIDCAGHVGFKHAIHIDSSVGLELR